MNDVPKYRKMSQEDLEKAKDDVCKSAYNVFRMLCHNNVRSTGISDLSKKLQELFEFEWDGKYRE